MNELKKEPQILSKFHPVIQAWFVRKFEKPSPPQEKGWPAIAAGQNCLILSPTGSGKTLAAFLWCIDELFRIGVSSRPEDFDQNQAGIHTLYISPLKALGYDIERNLSTPLREIQLTAKQQQVQPPVIRVAVRTGDTSAGLRRKMLRQPPHILITTPESLYLLLTSPKARTLFSRLRYIIVDEIHALCGNKRGVHLSLSLERLEELCATPPVRIGLSATQRPVEFIARFLAGGTISDDRYHPRPVQIVDCGLNKEIDLRAISPVADFSELPEASVWPEVYRLLHKLILEHKTTLIFVNMRAQTEKIARELNLLHRSVTGDSEAELALAHHGSLSREARRQVESRLKHGQIPAVVATASLELGIDIGSVDLVVHLESPRSVTGALQRVGRSGHMLSATSKGRLIPLYRNDLDDVVAIMVAMEEGAIESVSIPENCLDVLAQQIAAEVAVAPRTRTALFNLIRRSYCYRRLSESSYENVLNMLSGPYSQVPLKALQPQITYDPTTDSLFPRRATRLTAVLHGGTIPDRGYYGVYLQDGAVKIGEMEEEFVFESRVGSSFFLGNQEWRIEEIQADRILVSPVRASFPRPPFWKGGILFRDMETQQAVGRLRREWETKGAILSPAAPRLQDGILQNLIQFLSTQQEQTGKLPTDKRIVVEYFQDAGGQWNVVVQAPFGGRVTGIWAIAIAALLEKLSGLEVQYEFNDDGFLFRLSSEEDKNRFLQLLRTPFAELEPVLYGHLPSTPLFAILFRQNATRALLLPRSTSRRRIPLWLQRLRAADLLQAVKQWPDFPILLETYRECLQDVFDLSSLKTVLEKIGQAEITVHSVTRSTPSIMASGLVFRFLSSYLYETDQKRAAAEPAPYSREFLMDLIQSVDIPGLIPEELARKFDQQQQRLTEETRARNAEELFVILQDLGPLSEQELEMRSQGPVKEWLADLAKDGRIMSTSDGRWDQADRVAAPEPAEERILRYLAHRGPVTFAELQNRLAMESESLHTVLLRLEKVGLIVSGNLLREQEEKYWCEKDNFFRLYRQAVAERRQTNELLSPEDWNVYLAYRLRKCFQTGKIETLIHRFSGLWFPEHFWEREILFLGLAAGKFQSFQNTLQEFEQLVTDGELIVRYRTSEEASIPYFQFFRRGLGRYFMTISDLEEARRNLSGDAQQIYDFIGRNGASFWVDLVAGSSLPEALVEAAVRELVQAGLISCDHLPTLRQLSKSSRSEGRGHSNYRSRTRRPPRSLIQARIQQNIARKHGRWFRLDSLGVMGTPNPEQIQYDPEESARFWAELLLDRYGLIAKNLFRQESAIVSWYPVFQHFRRLEWRGEIERGYFVKGLSGVQFASTQTWQQLIDFQTKRKEITGLISAILPGISLEAMDSIFGQKKTGLRRGSGNYFFLVKGEIVAWAENFFSNLFCRRELTEEELVLLARELATFLLIPDDWRPRRRIEIRSINGTAAAETNCGRLLLRIGFEREEKHVILWPSTAATLFSGQKC